MMNRSAKDGARSSWNYGSEGVLTHPSYQGVCGRHGTEDLATRGELSDSRIVPQAWRKPGDRASGDRVGRGRRLAEVVGKRQRARE